METITNVFYYNAVIKWGPIIFDHNKRMITYTSEALLPETCLWPYRNLAFLGFIFDFLNGYVLHTVVPNYVTPSSLVRDVIYGRSLTFLSTPDKPAEPVLRRPRQL